MNPGGRRSDMPQLVHKPGDIVPGDLFEDCRYHPCLCYDVGDPPSDSVFGISLIDGSTWQCSIAKCRVRKLTLAETWRWKSEGPPDEDLPPETVGHDPLLGSNSPVPRRC
jgi:hypothetical protein